MKIRLTKSDWMEGIRFSIQDNGRYVENLKFVPKKECEYIKETGTINRVEAQILMDDLWNCGVRPTEGSGSAGSLKATQYHLEDMRRLLFAKTEPAKGEE